MMIEFIQLEKTPPMTLSKSHYFCDYIELIALCESDDIVSQQDIYNRFLDDERIDGVGTDGSSEINDDWNSRIQEWFDCLEIRTNLYGDMYPFEMKDNSISLKNNINDEGKVYIGLLLCSLLAYIKNTSLLTSVFEEISLISTKSYLNQTAKAYRFGVSTLNSGRYSGTLKNKIQILANDLDLNIVCDDRIFRKFDHGDGGVDIVAWIPFKNDENISRKQIFLGQSATGKKWHMKQNSVARIKNYINIPDNTQNVLYVPYDMRDSDRYFEEEGEITSSLIFDRFRILNLISPQRLWDSEQGEGFRTTIHEAIAFEEDIV